MKKYIIPLPNEISTVSMGEKLATACQQACIIYLYGDLGVGKTTFCRGFLRALGHKGYVKSPTYTIVELYKLPSWKVYHFDLYRLANPIELEFIGIRDYFDNTNLYLIEWPQYGKGILPLADIELKLKQINNGCQIQIQARSAIGERNLIRLA